MARPPRLHVPGGCYHVILRGNHREALFDSPADRDVLNGILVDAIRRFAARVHAFCWMTNHLHALMQVADQPLGPMMQRVAMRYSRHRHKALETTGHLFERRYNAPLVDTDAYFLVLLRYIHLNPVKANLASDPAEYRWTSHRAYLGTERIPWLSTELGLSLLGDDAAQARAVYAQFVPGPARNEVDGAPGCSMTLEQLAAEVCAEHGVTVAMLRSKSSLRDLAPVRAALAERAAAQGICSLTRVARFLGRDPSSLRKLMASHRSK